MGSASLIELLKQPLIYLSIGGMTLLITILVFMFSLKVYRLKKEISAANCLMWRHPTNSPDNMPVLELATIPAPAEGFEKAYRLTHPLPALLLVPAGSLSAKKAEKQIKLKTEYDSRMVKAYEQRFGPGSYHDKKRQMPLPGGVFHYRPAGISGYVVGWHDLKWCWEDEAVAGANPIKPFSPDDYIKPGTPGTDKTPEIKGSITTSELADVIDWRPAKGPLGLNKGKLLQKLYMGGVALMGCAALIGMVYLGVLLGG